MKLNRKTIISVFLIFLFGGSIFLSALDIFLMPNQGPPTIVETVVLETSKGVIEIDLFRDKAPITVENFVQYVNDGFYDDLVFHRIDKDFMVQGGGFIVNGTYRVPRQPIENEANNGLSNVVGTIAMARQTAPDTATSQFFINTNNNDFLDYQNSENPGYTVFGIVTSGMEVVRVIENIETGLHAMHFPDFGYPSTMTEEWPVEDVIIVRAYMKSD